MAEDRMTLPFMRRGCVISAATVSLLQNPARDRPKGVVGFGNAWILASLLGNPESAEEPPANQTRDSAAYSGNRANATCGES
jgi:hypothetical protein